MKGYEVLEAQNAIDGIKLATYQSPNIVIIDPNLPDLQGSEVLQKIGSQSNVPIIVLSAICAENEKVRLLPEGADDYVTKPFSMLELLARSESALRRYFVTREVLLDQKPVGLTRKEYRLLHILANHLGLVVTHEQLLKDIWTGPHRENIQYLRILVRKLRQKIETDPDRPRPLITESSVGYRLQNRLEAASATDSQPH
jgi:two-component system KDP operon response regulator KdpE